MTETYQIVRFFQRSTNDVVREGLTLAEAQEHCNDLESSSATAKAADALALTAEHGPWFDGYVEEETC